MPKVSVIVTTKNEERNIGRCLESVRAQTLGDLEIIVVDNASKDQTKAIAARYGAKVLDQGPERSAQRNRGVQESTGKYVLYLDADMILSPDVVERCVAMCEKDPELKGLYVPERIVGQGFWIKVRGFERTFYDGTVIDAVRFLPRAAFLASGGFDTSLCGPEDWDFDKRIRRLGRVAVAGCVLFHNEGEFDSTHYLGKKSYYARSMEAYVAKWGRRDADVRRQLGLVYRYFGVFLERQGFRKMLRHPVLTLAMYALRVRVGLRYLASRLA